jgi:cytidylate kinase
MIIVIDGPAGAGKSTTAKAVAKKLNIKYLDSGALYRALAWLFDEVNHERDTFVETLRGISVAFTYVDGNFHVFIDESDVTEYLRSERISSIVSMVASFPEARKFVNKLMRGAVKEDWYIAEGRDLGTAVFPDADLKLFLIADPRERARRRLKQLLASGVQATLSDVLENIERRDQKDANRANDPLQKADDAIEVDTTKLNFEEQVQQISALIEERTTINNNFNHNTAPENPA